MVTVTDQFGVTTKEIEAIQNEANRIESLGYKVPNIIIKMLPHAQGMAGLDNILISPNSNLEQLRYTIAHEIGHHNEPEQEFDLWSDETWEERNQKAEDFANWFAKNI